MEKFISITCTGDLILDEPGPVETYFEGSKEELLKTDVLIGQVEVPHTLRAQPSCIDVQAPPSNPEHLNVLKELGVDIATLATNHMYDCGPFGVIDTVAKLHELGIKTTGAGANIYEAKAPAYVERDGVKIGVLNYNTVGPRFGWALSSKVGYNYVDVLTVSRPVDDRPACPVKFYTFLEPDSKKKMECEIAQFKKTCDIAIVSFHKGAVGPGPNLLHYEYEITKAAVDAGADIVFGNHHHTLKGVEFYKGAPIFHGLNHFVAATYALTPGKNNSPEMIAYLEQRAREGRASANFDPPFYPFPLESRKTMLARVWVTKDGVKRAGFVPCLIDGNGVPQALTRDNGGQDILDEMIQRTEGAGLTASFTWSEDGTEVYFT